MRAVAGRLADGRDPRHVAVNDQHHVRRRPAPGSGTDDSSSCPCTADRRSEIIEPRRHRSSTPMPSVAPASPVRDGRRVAADERGDEQRRSRFCDRIGGSLFRAVFRRAAAGHGESSRQRRSSVSGVPLHHLARAGRYTGPFGSLWAICSARHDLLDVLRRAQLVVVFHVAAHDAALVAHVLNPVDELVAAAAQLALLRERRTAGEDEYRDARPCGIVHGAGQRLGAAFDMHEDRLCPAR